MIPSPWNPNDRVALRQYLANNPKFLAELEAQKPKITGTTLEERAVSGSDRNGYDLIRDLILSMSTDEEEQPRPQPFLRNE
jgi:hypothetical protein